MFIKSPSHPPHPPPTPHVLYKSPRGNSIIVRHYSKLRKECFSTVGRVCNMDQAGGFLLRHASQIRNSMVNLANLQPRASSQWCQGIPRLSQCSSLPSICWLYPLKRFKTSTASPMQTINDPTSERSKSIDSSEHAYCKAINNFGRQLDYCSPNKLFTSPPFLLDAILAAKSALWGVGTDKVILK